MKALSSVEPIPVPSAIAPEQLWLKCSSPVAALPEKNLDDPQSMAPSSSSNSWYTLWTASAIESASTRDLVLVSGSQTIRQSSFRMSIHRHAASRWGNAVRL